MTNTIPAPANDAHEAARFNLWSAGPPDKASVRRKSGIHRLYTLRTTSCCIRGPGRDTGSRRRALHPEEQRSHNTVMTGGTA